MTRLAGDLGDQVVLHQAFSVRVGGDAVDPAGDVVLPGGVAAGAGEILTVHAHMNIQGLVRFGQRTNASKEAWNDSA